MRIFISSTVVYYPFRDASCRFAKTHLRKVDRSQESELIFVLMQHSEMHGLGRCTCQKQYNTIKDLLYSLQTNNLSNKLKKEKYIKQHIRFSNLLPTSSLRSWLKFKCNIINRTFDPLEHALILIQRKQVD